MVFVIVYTPLEEICLVSIFALIAVFAMWLFLQGSRLLSVVWVSVPLLPLLVLLLLYLLEDLVVQPIRIIVLECQ